MTAAQSITSAKKARLVRVFGQEGTKLILQHIDDLEEIFGSASIVMRMVMEGKLPRNIGSEDPVFN